MMRSQQNRTRGIDQKGTEMIAINLKCEHMFNPLGISIKDPVLTWTCSGDVCQSAYQIVCFDDTGVLLDTGKVESRKMMWLYSGKAESRDRVFWKVKLWNENGEEGDFSDTAFFEYGLLENEFEAEWIDPETEGFDPQERQPASYLFKEFEAGEYKQARIYATAHGIYSLYINGKRVMEDLLCPGTSEYWYRLPYQTFDVTDYIRKGNNRIDAVLGDGWWRGCNGNTGERNVFGKDIALLLQLELDKKVVVKSDESWMASNEGPIRSNDLQLGETVDARKQIEKYHEVKVKEYGYENLICANSLPIREKEAFDAKLIHTPDGNKVLDFGQNLAGWVSFRVEAKNGQRIRLTLGEYLDEEGNFSDRNFETIGRKEPLHQVIDYTCKDGLNEYRSQFCISGFRYALLETDIEITGSEFLSHAVYSDLKQTCEFECDNELVNRLFHNAVWSTKSNFVGIPTDCPQRERSGWTGDAALYAYTGLRLMDTYPVFRRWLAEERAVQHEDGRVRNFAPRRSAELTFLDKVYDGSTAWGDASVIVPYQMYQLYRDKRILEENYDFMKRWLKYCEKKAGRSRLNHLFHPYRKYIIDTGIHYGEWLEADVSMKDSMKQMILKGVPDIATAYFAYSCRMMSEIADILQKEEDAKYYQDLYGHVLKAYKSLEIKNGRIDTDRQCRLVRPLAMGLLNKEEEKNISAQLNELVIRNGYHLNTGFLTTPHLCRVLARNGYVDTAYRLLLQDDTPSWLFAVKNGATTIWESWEGYFGDIGVASLNHYSKGAVVSWFVDGVCGINVDDGKITIRPYISPLLKHASAGFESPYGRIRSSWIMKNGKTELTVEIPSNTEGKIVFSDGTARELKVGVNRIEYH